MRLGPRHGVTQSFVENKNNSIIVDSIVPLPSLRRAKRFHCCAVGTSSWRRAFICGVQEQFHYCIVPVTKISRNSKHNLVLLSTHAFSHLKAVIGHDCNRNSCDVGRTKNIQGSGAVMHSDL